MTIFFKDFSAGKHPTLKFSPGLVLGWLTTENCMETRYALYQSGLVMQAEPIGIFAPGCDEFNPKGRTWTTVDAVPAHAEFIGNYKPLVRVGA